MTVMKSAAAYVVEPQAIPTLPVRGTATPLRPWTARSMSCWVALSPS